jgi:3-phenylpropionate/trans-cinnamate dioxygenase ferredoxin subunit
MGKIKIAEVRDIGVGQAKGVDVEGKRIALFNVDGNYYAVDDECSHAGGSLSEGSVSGHSVMCPLHGAEFDLKNGQVMSEPAEEAVGSYKVTVDGDGIFIEI